MWVLAVVFCAIPLFSLLILGIFGTIWANRPHKLGDFLEIRTLYGREADSITPYMSQVIVGRLRFHWFHRGDEDPDPHDHPWRFWTFPFTSYWEEVTDRRTNHKTIVPVLSWRVHYRPALYTHRVLYPIVGATPRDVPTSGPIISIVWTGAKERAWGFLKTRGDVWCWTAWREYIYRGGKDAPCK